MIGWSFSKTRTPCDATSRSGFSVLGKIQPCINRFHIERLKETFSNECILIKKKQLISRMFLIIISGK